MGKRKVKIGGTVDARPDKTKAKSKTKAKLKSKVKPPSNKKISLIQWAEQERIDRKHRERNKKSNKKK